MLPGAPIEFANAQTFSVEAGPIAPRVGDAAPSLSTATTADTPIDELSSHPNPPPALYETSLEDALAAHAPVLVVFASVGLCYDDVCERAVDQAAGLAKATGITAIHLEFVTDYDTHPIPGPNSSAYHAWNLDLDPWIYVIDRDGRVAARFEVIVADDILRAAVEAVLAD